MCGGKRIEIIENGPYVVYGQIPLKKETLKKGEEERSEEWEETREYYPGAVYTLCRCGKSVDKPFCTGNHVDFDGTETAPKNSFSERAFSFHGAEGIILMQDVSLCVRAGFCHGKDWIVDTFKDRDTIDTALQQTYDCPGGSLLLKIDGEEREPVLEKEISAVTVMGIVGPLWVKGGIPVVSSDGSPYEVRNRTALCRCGKSKNKPFCDSMHLRVKLS
ncbi:MAG: CDGSH iron-sulfur domain-containing protein [Methanomassiliicoccaceae archaeon]|nr:CDGSH iron-sulfur domain-containing protein [Methanomassiliicoccaceae archaeon]